MWPLVKSRLEKRRYHVQHAGKTWLFTNVKDEGGSSLNALHVYWAESPLSETWHPHPANPVVRDIGSARPAGRIFVPPPAYGSPGLHGCCSNDSSLCDGAGLVSLA